MKNSIIISLEFKDFLMKTNRDDWKCVDYGLIRREKNITDLLHMNKLRSYRLSTYLRKPIDTRHWLSVFCKASDRYLSF